MDIVDKSNIMNKISMVYSGNVYKNNIKKPMH